MSQKPETLALHAGWRADPTTGAVAVPIYQTTSYQFRSAEHAAICLRSRVGNIYTRIMNPTNDVLEKRVAALEGGVGALALACGQAASAFAIRPSRSTGDKSSPPPRSTGARRICSPIRCRDGIEVRFVDPASPRIFEALIDARTKAVFVESLGNPQGNITDFERIAAIAHRHGVPLIVDNTCRRRI